MTAGEFQNLSRGDIVRHVSGGPAYVVSSNYGSRVTAMDTVDMTNPNEWDVVLKADYHKTRPEGKRA